MLERLPKTRRNIGLALVAFALLWFAWVIRSVLNPLILGYLLAYILRPYVQWLEAHKMGRRAAVNIIFSVFAVVLTVTSIGVVVQAREIVETVIIQTEGGEDPIAIAEDRIDAAIGDVRGWFEGMFAEEESASPSEGDPEVDPAVAPVVAPVVDPDGKPENEHEAGEPGSDQGVVSGEQTGASVVAAAAPANDRDRHVLRNLLRSWAMDLTDRVGESGGTAALASMVFHALAGLFGGVLSVFGFMVLLPVYTYFLLFELERIHTFLRSHVPKRERGRVTRIARQIGEVIASFFRGRLLICFLKGSVIAFGLTIASVPHAFLLGMTSGFLSLIPFVGPVVGFALTFLIGVGETDVNGEAMMGVVDTLIWIVPVFVVAEALEGYVLIPKILGDSLGLHPVVILVSVFAGGAALGLFGFLLAVPLAATAIILFRELVMPAVEEFAEEDSHVDEAVEPG